jgi:asparagine synthase (glutamine-hydrolysing)
MWNKIRKIRSIYRAMGLRWVVFRAGYYLRRRTGLIRLQSPAYAWSKYSLRDRVQSGTPLDPGAYQHWKREYFSSHALFLNASYPSHPAWNTEEIVREAQHCLSGEVRYFHNSSHRLGFPPDWFLDPFTNFRYDPQKHWSEIPDYGQTDIKFVWEASRFSQIFTLLRAYAVNHGPAYPQAFWYLISDWMEHNPPGLGPNWKDGQEVSLRLLAACFGYLAFFNDSETSPQQLERFTLFAAAHAQRILQNIRFAEYTKSNHTISEGFGLWLSGALFPELKNAEKYARLGRNILEQEIRDQFFADGGYAMYSLNYQRFSLHLYLLVIHWADKLRIPFSDQMRQTFGKSIEFLLGVVEPQTGKMPQFGSNDGSLVLPLNQCDFGDYRPLIQAGYYLLHQKRYFPAGDWDEDLFWLFGVQALEAPLETKLPALAASYPEAGLHVLGKGSSRAIVRCVDFRSRPSHADQLHLDLWWHGVNIACDAGTYLYHGSGVWENGLASTQVHNTVTVDQMDQMTRISRITWVDWAKGEASAPADNRLSPALWRGKQDGYRSLKDPVDQQRSVLELGPERWLILDHLSGKTTHHYRLHWLLADLPYQELEHGSGLILKVGVYACRIQMGATSAPGDFSIQRASPNTTRGWRSTYYAQKDPAISLVLEQDCQETIFWTYFGYADDEIAADDTKINISYAGQTHSLNFSKIIGEPF